jgi:hypothetical protein
VTRPSKQILDREGNASKRRQRLALRARCINGFGAGKRAGGRDIRIGLQQAIAARDGCQMLFRHKPRCDLAAPHCIRNVVRGLLRPILHA